MMSLVLCFQLYNWNRVVIFRGNNFVCRQGAIYIEEALQNNGFHVAEVLSIYISQSDGPIPSADLDFKLNSAKERSRGIC